MSDFRGSRVTNAGNNQRAVIMKSEGGLDINEEKMIEG